MSKFRSTFRFSGGREKQGTKWASMLFPKCENWSTQNRQSLVKSVESPRGNTSQRNTRAHLSGFRYPHDAIDENDICSSCQVCTRIRGRENANAFGSWVYVIVRMCKPGGDIGVTLPRQMDRLTAQESLYRPGKSYVRMRGRNSKEPVNWSFQPREFRKSEHVVKRPSNRSAWITSNECPEHST